MKHWAETEEYVLTPWIIRRQARSALWCEGGMTIRQYPTAPGEMGGSVSMSIHLNAVKPGSKPTTEEVLDPGEGNVRQRA